MVKNKEVPLAKNRDIIKEVQSKPILWNQNHINYKNKGLRLKTWINVTIIVMMNGDFKSKPDKKLG